MHHKSNLSDLLLVELFYVGNKRVKQLKNQYKDFLFEYGENHSLYMRLKPESKLDNCWWGDRGNCLANADEDMDLDSYFDDLSPDDIIDMGFGNYVDDGEVSNIELENDVSYDMRESFNENLSKLHEELSGFNAFYELKNTWLRKFEPTEKHIITYNSYYTYDSYDNYYLLYEVDGFRFHLPVYDDEFESLDLPKKSLDGSDIPTEITIDKYKQYKNADIFEIIGLIRSHLIPS